MMQTDVKGVNCPVGTTTVAGRTRLKGLFVSASAAGTVAILDGATPLFTYTFLGGATTTIDIPGEGVLCLTSLIITVSAACTAVAYYG